MIHLIFPLAGCSAILLCALFLVRNSWVRDELLRVLEEISKRAKALIEEGKPWEQEYDLFRLYTYDEMLLKFWKPVSSFYRGKI